MMDWRRFWIAFLADGAVIFAMDRPWPLESIAGMLAYGAVYLALGYLRERR